MLRRSQFKLTQIQGGRRDTVQWSNQGGRHCGSVGRRRVCGLRV